MSYPPTNNVHKSHTSQNCICCHPATHASGKTSKRVRVPVYEKAMPCPHVRLHVPLPHTRTTVFTPLLIPYTTIAASFFFFVCHVAVYGCVSLILHYSTTSLIFYHSSTPTQNTYSYLVAYCSAVGEQTNKRIIPRKRAAHTNTKSSQQPPYERLETFLLSIPLPPSPTLSPFTHP